jgi:hypothetical protein
MEDLTGSPASGSDEAELGVNGEKPKMMMPAKFVGGTGFGRLSQGLPLLSSLLSISSVLLGTGGLEYYHTKLQ